jgi:hypothetical protein
MESRNVITANKIKRFTDTNGKKRYGQYGKIRLLEVFVGLDYGLCSRLNGYGIIERLDLELSSSCVHCESKSCCG